MTYAVKEIFYTLQGEGHNAGRAAVFVRFTGCNLWSGREQDRKSGCSKWCDTDFLGGRRYYLDDLVETICDVSEGCRFVVLTGGEPALQITAELISLLKRESFNIAVETNGTTQLPEGVYWRTVSPKKLPLVVTTGHELKLVYPTLDPAQFLGFDFQYFYLQPLDNEAKQSNTTAAIEYCKEHPAWRLSTQTHKIVGIP